MPSRASQCRTLYVIAFQIWMLGGIPGAKTHCTTDGPRVDCGEAYWSSYVSQHQHAQQAISERWALWPQFMALASEEHLLTSRVRRNWRVRVLGCWLLLVSDSRLLHQPSMVFSSKCWQQFLWGHFHKPFRWCLEQSTNNALDEEWSSSKSPRCQGQIRFEFHTFVTTKPCTYNLVVPAIVCASQIAIIWQKPHPSAFQPVIPASCACRGRIATSTQRNSTDSARARQGFQAAQCFIGQRIGIRHFAL